MYEIGKYNEMTIVRKADFGYYLDSKTGNTDDDVLIPNGSLDGNEVKVGDSITVFIYRDSKDRIIATMKKPLITVGEVKKLEVVGISEHGAFISMGLERDVFVPKKEQKFTLVEGNKYLFKLYVDKSGRLAATTDVNGALETAPESTFKKDEEVSGTIYLVQPNGTVFIAIDNQYKGVLNHGDYFQDFKGGDVAVGRILKVLEDGRPLLTTRSNLKDERLSLKDEIIKKLRTSHGFIPFNDKSTPEEIKDEFKTSKNYFKRAVGNLMKDGLITQDEDGLHLVKREKENVSEHKGRR